MKVTINNKETETQAKTIRELAQELDLPATGVAVAISNEMVPRDEWENTIIYIKSLKRSGFLIVVVNNNGLYFACAIIIQ